MGNARILVDVSLVGEMLLAGESELAVGARLLPGAEELLVDDGVKSVVSVTEVPKPLTVVVATGVALAVPPSDCSDIVVSTADVLAVIDDARLVGLPDGEIGSTVDETSFDRTGVLDDIAVIDETFVADGISKEELVAVDKTLVLERTVVEGAAFDGELLALEDDAELTMASNVEDPEVIVVIVGIAKETNDGPVTEGIICDDISDVEACLAEFASDVIKESTLELDISATMLVGVVEFSGTERPARGIKAWLQEGQLWPFSRSIRFTYRNGASRGTGPQEAE